MVRVKNEEEFLYPSVKSIIDVVDEVVLIDNLSTDGTPLVIRSLQREYPEKVACHQYKYEIRRRGREHWELASTRAGRSSLHLSSNYYNWCLERCGKPYALKWDGDMIATEAFYEGLESWRRSSAAVLFVRGANVHSDRRHLLAAKSSDTARAAEVLTVPVVPQWITSMSYTSQEPRLFPRIFARYGTEVWWTQSLSTPFIHPGVGKRFVRTIDEPCFLHLKFCKRQPYSDYSADFFEMITSNLTVGPVLRPEWQELLRRWKV